MTVISPETASALLAEHLIAGVILGLAIIITRWMRG